MKTIIGLLIGITCSFSLHAQTSITDSLKGLLQSAKQDTARVKLLSKLEANYMRVDKDSAFAYVQQHIILCQKLRDASGLSDAYVNLGYWYYIQSNFPKALEYNYKGLKMAEEVKDSLIRGRAYNNLGHVMLSQKNYAEALASYKKFLAFIPASAKQDATALAHYNIGYAFLKLKQPDSALRYAEEGYQLFRTAEDKMWMAGCIRVIANAQFMLGNHTLGEAYFKVAVATAVQTNNRGALAMMFTEAASRFLEQGNKDSALYYCKTALQIFQKLNRKNSTIECYALLTDIFQDRHQTDSAFFYQSKMVQLNKQIAEENGLANIQNINFEERLREQENEAEEHKAKELRTRNLQYSLIALGLVSFFVFFFLFSYSIMATQKLIRFLGVVALLIVFEFINLYIHPYLAHVTNDSPLLMLLVMVFIAALLVPLHHRMEHWITHRLVEKNNKIRLAAAKKTIAKLETEESLNSVK